MSIKKPIYCEFNLERTYRPDLLAVVHVNNCSNDVIELCVKQGKSPISLVNATVTAIVVTRKPRILLSDNVSCTVNEAGNILIPFDNAVFQSCRGDIFIEVQITDPEGCITLPFPIWVRVNGSVLEDAQINDHTHGTVAQLLQQANEELARVKNLVDADIIYAMIESNFPCKENTSNKVTSISASSTNAQYPSALAVKNYVDTALGVIENGSY